MKHVSTTATFLTILMAFCMLCTVNVEAKPGKAKGKFKTKVKKHTPPPHAPAHGYKHRHSHGVDLTFDSGVGAYVVVGKPGLYYRSGLYMKLTDGVWKVTTHFNSPWRLPKVDEVPDLLKKAKAAKPAIKVKLPVKKGKKK